MVALGAAREVGMLFQISLYNIVLCGVAIPIAFLVLLAVDALVDIGVLVKLGATVGGIVTAFVGASRAGVFGARG